MADEPKSTVGRESDKFMLRFPDGMRERITELAKQNGRSMNAEIIARIESSFIGGGDNTSLLATIARLNLDIALAELEKTGLEAEAANLAFSLNQATELLLHPQDEPDEVRRKLVRIFTDQAKPHLGKVGVLTTNLEDRLARTTVAVHSLSEARAKLIQMSSAAKPDANASAAEPPKRPARVTRSVKKQGK